MNGLALANIQKEEPKNEKTSVFANRLTLTDEHAGEKIKDIADNVGFISAILALFIGFFIWYKGDDFMGFFIGLVVSGAGIYAAHIGVSMLHTYADMVTMNIEQMKILKELEATQVEELAQAKEREKKEQRERERREKEQRAADELTAAGMWQASSYANDALLRELAEPQEKAAGVRTKVVMVGMLDKRVQIAHFDGRHDLELICPLCNRTQLADGDGCIYCGCKFIFDDEQLLDNDITTEIA